VQKLLVLAVLAISASIAGCSIYRPDINQGQVISYEAVSELNQGLTKNEVLDLLGTPLVRDSFHQDRWDYVYYLIDRNRNITRQQIVTVLFEDGILTNVTHNIEEPQEEPESSENPEQ